MKIAIVLAAALAAPAVASAASPNACFRTRDIVAHRKADDHTLYLRVNLHDVYRVTTRNTCFAGSTNVDALVFGSTPSGQVCSPVELDLGVKNEAHVTPCLVDTITKLTPQEAAALPKGVRP